jgi:hypothetical protein
MITAGLAPYRQIWGPPLEMQGKSTKSAKVAASARAGCIRKIAAVSQTQARQRQTEQTRNRGSETLISDFLSRGAGYVPRCVNGITVGPEGLFLAGRFISLRSPRG